MSGLDVHVGFWNNYQPGSQNDDFAHWTLTIWARDGALLTAFLALFTTVSMASIWPIFCFVMHQFRSSSKPRSGIYHQQQALLCNTPPTATTALRLTQIAWSWRQAKIQGSRRKSIPLILVALVFLGLSGAVSLLSSRIQMESDEVLAKGSSCGYIGFGPLRIVDEASLSSADTINRQTASSYWSRLTAFQCLEYTRYCYSASHLDNSNLCQRYTKPFLTVKENLDADCPFGDKLCAENKAIHVDTGLVDSNKDLGINSPAADRIWFRKLLTCAPIQVDGEDYSTPWTTERILDESDSSSRVDAHPAGTIYKYYNLGPQSSARNYSFEVNNNSFASTDGLGRVYGLGYVSTFSSFSEQSMSNNFEPIPELDVADSDVTLLYLLNNARYVAPVEDAWFRATSNGTRDSSGAGRVPNPPYFMSDQAVSTLACTEQYQFCSDPNTCSPVGGLNDNSTNPYLGLDLNPSQKALFNLLVFCARSITITNAVDLIGSQILRANELVWGGSDDLRSSVLPPDQWQQEVLNFSYTMLAAMQSLMAGFAAPPNFPVYTLEGRVMSHRYLDPPTTKEEAALCSKVRLRDPRYTNFDVAGIILLLAMGLTAMFINMVLLPGAVFWIQKKLRWNEHGRREWLGGHLFMQQKAAFEAHGVGPWHVDSDGAVPWTPGVVQNEVIKVADGQGSRPRTGGSMSAYEAIPLEGREDHKWNAKS